MNLAFLQKWKYSLGTKFALLVAGILVAIFSIVAVLTYRSENRLHLDSLADKGRDLGYFLASIAPQPILSHDYATLHYYVREISGQEDVVYAAVLSPEEVLLTSYFNRDDPRVAVTLSEIGNNDASSVLTQMRTQTDILSLRTPIVFNNKPLGFFDLGLNKTRAMRNAAIALRRQLFGNLAIILALGAYILVVFRLNALTPIQRLMHGTKRVARGDLDHTIAVKSKDELGDLTHAFNAMTGTLKTRTREKDDALSELREVNKTLESRVELRTRELAAANRELQYLALHDDLTGLANRSALRDRLTHAIDTATRDHTSVTVIMMDLDRFKEINDTLGHNIGDQLLQQVSARLRTVLREGDTAGRLGGDEFAVVLPGSDRSHAVRAAQDLLGILEPRFILADMSFSVGASFGIVIFPDHGSDSVTLLKRADIAMYLAKASRRGYLIYDPKHDSHTTDKLGLMAELRSAIETNVLQLHYQPIFDQRLNCIVGMEALVRWPHPTRGLILPDAFIPLIEQSELIKPLTYWVVDTALREWTGWTNNGGPTLRLSINLSMRNLHDPRFPDQLAALVNKWNVPFDFLVLEITEGAMMYDTKHVMQVLGHLNGMGLRIAVDDFGIGYSSLRHLSKLPVDELKIDSSFVRHMTTDNDNATIVRSTIDLAHNLGMRVVAEGVETREIFDMLAGLNCDMVQGDYVGRPLPPSDANEIVKAANSGHRHRLRRASK